MRKLSIAYIAAIIMQSSLCLGIELSHAQPWRPPDYGSLTYESESFYLPWPFDYQKETGETAARRLRDACGEQQGSDQDRINIAIWEFQFELSQYCSQLNFTEFYTTNSGSICIIEYQYHPVDIAGCDPHTGEVNDCDALANFVESTVESLEVKGSNVSAVFKGPICKPTAKVLCEIPSYVLQ